MRAALALFWGAAACTTPVVAEQPEGPTLEGRGVVALAEDGSHLALASVEGEPDGALRGEGASMAVPGEPALEVEAPVTEWDLRGGRASFSGGVRVVRGPFVLTCAELELTRGADGRVREAQATGEVEVTRPPWTARASRATLTLPEGLLVLEGEPVVDDGRNRLTGRRVELWLDDERLRCEGCVLALPDPLAPLPGAP